MVAKRDRGRQTARGLGEATRFGEKGVRRGWLCVCVCVCERERETMVVGETKREVEIRRERVKIPWSSPAHPRNSLLRRR